MGRFAMTRNHFCFMGQKDKVLQICGNVNLFHISQLTKKTHNWSYMVSLLCK